MRYESGCKAYESGCKTYEKQGEDACWQLGSVVNDPFDMVPFVRYCCRVLARRRCGSVQACDLANFTRVHTAKQHDV